MNTTTLPKLYAVPNESAPDICWGSCGQGQCGAVVVYGRGCIPCRKDVCPHEESTLDLGHHEIMGEDVQLIVRKLKGKA